MGCSQSTTKEVEDTDEVENTNDDNGKKQGGHHNFHGLETEFARIFLEKHGKRNLIVTEDRHGNKCEKHIGDHPMTWDELVHGMEGAEIDQLGRKIGPSNFFWRSSDVDEKRQTAYKKNKEKWGSTADRLHSELFGWDSEKREDGRLIAVKSKNTKRKTMWMANDFPYSWEDGISHDLCWATDLPALSLKECNNMIKKKLGQGREAVWFTNSMKNRSVPEIDHIQILSRTVQEQPSDLTYEVSADAEFTGP
mmetsp:Transcript_85/g.113  ORF Transcript_85/g.113 Transcript_85/m.113 type:complete len:251 (+) Transcript_85:37-789(+)